MKTAMQCFLENVQIQDDGCWQWTGARHYDGYGTFAHGGQKHRAHKWLYEETRAKVMRGLVLRHQCDMPSCVNPDHLVVGTAKQNSQDMVRSGNSKRCGSGKRMSPQELEDCINGPGSNAEKAARIGVTIKSVVHARMRARRAAEELRLAA